jgi:hypothetical protein
MKSATAQIAFRYHAHDSATGITRTTAKRLSAILGVDEIQVIHLALHELAAKVLPAYDADDAALTQDEIKQIQKTARKAQDGQLRSSLFDAQSA